MHFGEHTFVFCQKDNSWTKLEASQLHLLLEDKEEYLDAKHDRMLCLYHKIPLVFSFFKESEKVLYR